MTQYKLILRVLFKGELWEYRKSCGKTQEEMAEELHITARSYSDLEHGIYGVSTVTLLFFLNQLSATKMAEVVRTFVLQAKEADENVRIF